MRTACFAGYTGIFGIVLIAAPVRTLAQAAPGPLAPPPEVQAQTQAAPPARPAPKPKPPQLPPRTSLAGSWKLNHDDSDDPLQKVRSAESSTVNTNAGRGPDPMGHPGGYPYPGGYPGGGPWGGYPGGGGSRQGSGGEDIAGNPKMQPLIHPPDIMDIDIKNPEVDVTDDHFKKLIIYTDGRQLPKKIDEDHPEIVAHWSGSQLVSDEKSPLSGKMSRTYELSGDGRKLYETVHIDHGKRPAIVIRYVYDATNSDVQSRLGTDDPDRPVIKRHSASDDSDTSPEAPQ